MQGRSAWRPLRQAETEAYGGSSRRVLYGCVVTMMNSNCNSSVPEGWNSARLDAYKSLPLSKDETNLLSQVGSIKTCKGLSGASGSSLQGSFTISHQDSAFKQLLLTWSRVR
jgi:hypothetical protein